MYTVCTCTWTFHCAHKVLNSSFKHIVDAAVGAAKNGFMEITGHCSFLCWFLLMFDINNWCAPPQKWCALTPLAPKSVHQAWKMCTALTAAQMSTVCTVCSGQPANDKNRNHSAWTKRLDIQVDVQVYYKTSSPIVQSISTITVFPASKLAVIISFKTIKNCLAVSTNSLRLKDSIPLFWLEV